MAATQATFKLGIQFDGWKGPDDSYFHAFGLTGKDHWAAGFQHFWLDGQARGHTESYDDYCLELMAARAGKFAHLPDDRMSYAYQLDSTLYGRFLRRMAEGDGATRIEGKIARVDLDGESGDIAALVLDSGTRVEGDLFLDCTGFRALLIEQALHVGYDDWTHWLPCDAAIAVQTESVRPPVPFTRAMAHDAGWQWRIPLQHRVGNGIVYCSRYLSQDAALDRLLGNVEGAVLTEPNRLRFVTGARRKQWHRNCIAIGLAGGFMEPLESTSIHLIQRAILRLIRLLPPAGAISAHDIAEFNDQQLTDMDQIRDFLILHYKVTERRDSPFWRQCAAMDIPDSLAQKIGLFRETGRVFRRNDELFAENSWIQVMLGQASCRRPITRSPPSCPTTNSRPLPRRPAPRRRDDGARPARPCRLCRALLRRGARLMVRRRQAVTIRHVAADAGVSLQTVSRVINKEPNVRPEMMERVQASIAKLGYVPSIAAQRMAGRDPI